jgi:hypothetical protein
MELSLPEERQAFILAVFNIRFYCEGIKLCEHCLVSQHNGSIETEGLREKHAEDSKLAGTYRGEFKRTQ